MSRASFEALRKARGIFRDYVLDLYFPAHRLTRWQRLRCIPFLFFIEYLVYRVDAVAENTKRTDLDVDGNADYDKLVRYKKKFAALLHRMGAYNEAVAFELDMGEKYVRLENKATTRGSADHDEVLRLAELRPSDVRLLHGMTFALLGRPVDDKMLKLMWPVEVLADIGNDLLHYEDDVAAGQFNTYDAFVRLYGRAAPQRLRAEIARYEQLMHAELEKFPPDERTALTAVCAQRYRSSTERIPAPQLPGAAGRAEHERAP
ncbi:hypothetical protein ACFOWZ_13365 [Lentzea rhizosphaerae]|uniref:Uncharacterized protein n=1 Tax=Lentzea rhizosphaerae TaxID=2041025 RepID=A0ABV8BR42_9PSEU